MRTSNEYHPLFIQNQKVLQDFWTRPFTLTVETQERVLHALRLFPGVSVAVFLDAHPEIVVDVIWYLLASHQIFTDLTATSLLNWEEVFLYLNSEEVEAAKQPNTTAIR